MATTPKSTNESSTPKQIKTTPKKATTTQAKPTATTSETKKTVSTASSARVIPGISQEVINEMTVEINAMLAFAANKGLTINPDVVALIKSETIEDLVDAHNMLCTNVAPATPKSIMYTTRIRENNRGKSFFRQIPLVRNLIILSVLFLVAYVWLGQTEYVTNDSLDKGVLDNQGVSLIVNLSFLASIAGLGVLFHLLKQVSNSVLKSTLVPEETINYVSQILLGVIAGLILSEVIVLYTSDPTEINLFNKSVLALIGGFSSDALFSILDGLITRLKSIFVPSGS